MELIRHLPALTAPHAPPVFLRVDRHVLAKRRWRGRADDGREFGFDLIEPLRDGQLFFCGEKNSYVIAQEPEPVLLVSVANAREAATVGWQVGNLHFPVAVADDHLLAPDDPALRQMFMREGIVYHQTRRVFAPLGGAGMHSHHHHHH